MTSTPDAPGGEDLGALRDEIDALKNAPVEELVDPQPAVLKDLAPDRTDAIGTEKWDEPASEEQLDV